MINEKFEMRNGKSAKPFHVGGACLTLRSIVSFPCANLRLLQRALHLYANRSKLTIARFVGWIVTQTVLRADLCCYPRKSRARILQTRREEIPATARLRQLIHFAAREVVEVTANLHLFERPHLTKIYKVFRLGTRIENLSVPLQLFSGKRQAAIVLAVFQ